MAATAADINQWIVGAGLDGVDQPELLDGYCERLAGAGVPLWRAAIGTDTLHPLIDTQVHRWVAGNGAIEELLHRDTSRERADEWQASPWYRLLEDRETVLRRRIGNGEGTNEYPLLAQLAEEGGTDYLARVVAFGERVTVGESRAVASSWTSRTPGGFGDADLALIDATLPAFALAYKATTDVETARSLVTTYLGRDPGRRLLAGEIGRGGVTTERKVVWFSDLVDFTRLADTLPRDQLLGLLNAYCDCLVGIVHEHGGDVLKFIGDGILAVFRGAEADACRAALDAADTARAAVASLNGARLAGGVPVTGFTLALHAGDVFYGNVGSSERLDFTVVGPAVNEASRILALSRSLDQSILVSESFAAACGGSRGRLVSVGRYALRGVGRPQELFTMESALAGSDAG